MPELLPPLLNYHTDVEKAKTPNFGTVVDFAPYPGGFSTVKIHDWRQRHPDLKVFVAYGVNATSYSDGTWSLGHGSHIAIEGKGVTRYYWYVAGNSCWDDLRMPEQVIVNWDRGEWNRQLHFPDLKWFDPYYGFVNGVSVKPTMSREELGQEIKRRVAALQLE